MNENQPVRRRSARSSPPIPDDGDTHSFSLVTGTGSTDNGSFTISRSSLRTNAVFKFEAKSSYSIRMRLDRRRRVE